MGERERAHKENITEREREISSEKEKERKKLEKLFVQSKVRYGWSV
jgi:hypothetical protein